MRTTKKRPPKCGGLKSVNLRTRYRRYSLAVPPSESVPSVSVVPRTMSIRLTDAALDGPVGRAAIPGAAAIVVVEVVAMTDPVGCSRSRAAERDRPYHTERCG